MFSSASRCVYQKNQLADVICQFRFPEILSIEATIPAAFQEEIRQEFPVYSVRRESAPPRLTGAPGQLKLDTPAATNNYQFATADGVWRVNLTSKFISLACSRYSCWEGFAAKLDKPLAAFIRLYKPAYFERIGLRYLNFISRKSLELEDTPYRELISEKYLGLLGDEEVNDPMVSRSTVDAELAIRGGCRAKIHAGPGKVKMEGRNIDEVRFVFDQDLFMPGNIPVNLCAPSLSTLHAQAHSIFRDAITQRLHEAMEPEFI